MTRDTAPSGDRLELEIQGHELVFDIPPEPHFRRPLSDVLDDLGQGRVTGARLEVAIADIEDLIMPVLRDLPPGMQLVARGALFAAVVDLLPSETSRDASIDAVERLFNDLADHAEGSVLAWRHAARPEDLALALLVLREVMHHGGFGCVSSPSEGAES